MTYSESQDETPTFEQELTDRLNKHSIDAKTNTADWILATHIITMLNAVKDLNDARESSRGGWGHIPLGYDEPNNIFED